MEQTFYEIEDEGQKLKFFTWINTAYSKVWNTSFFLRYDTKRFYIRNDIGYYDYHGKANTADTHFSLKEGTFWNRISPPDIHLRT